MKKMITLGLISCVSLTSSTMFGMLTNKFCKHAGQRRTYTTNQLIILGEIMTRAEYIDSRSRDNLAATKEINRKLDLLIAQIQEAKTTPMQQAPQQEQHRLQEWQPVVCEPKELYSTSDTNTDASKFNKEYERYHNQRELDAYHVRSSTQE